MVRAHTSDLLPTLCSLVGQPLPGRPLDGIDVSGLLDGTLTERQSPIHFWAFDMSRFESIDAEPYIDPKLQEGTTPLAKLMAGKATRDFRNYRHPPITAADYRGARAIIDGRYKLVIHERQNYEPNDELFDLEADPAEKMNLLEQEGAIAEKLKKRLYTWQQSVLNSLTGADYR
jgi:arylsulfatase A-like enzyme